MNFVDEKATGIVTMIVDTEKDILTEIPDRWETGGLCYIAETTNVKF